MIDWITLSFTSVISIALLPKSKSKSTTLFATHITRRYQYPRDLYERSMTDSTAIALDLAAKSTVSFESGRCRRESTNLLWHGTEQIGVLQPDPMKVEIVAKL